MAEIIRFSVSLPKVISEKVDRLIAFDGTKADVLRKAIALYDLLHREGIEKGYTIAILDKDEVKKELVLY